jgi:hypothetical protein
MQEKMAKVYGSMGHLHSMHNPSPFANFTNAANASAASAAHPAVPSSSFYFPQVSYVTQTHLPTKQAGATPTNKQQQQ